MRCWCKLEVASWSLVLAGALQSPLCRTRLDTLRMASSTPNNGRTADQIGKLEECIAALDPTSDDPNTFSELMDQLMILKKEGLAPGSRQWATVVVEAQQRTEAFAWAYQQRTQERGQAFVRGRDWAEREAAKGLTPGSYEWAAAVGKASAESAQAFQEAEEQMAAAREAARSKRAALLAALFADSSGGQTAAPLATSLSTDAALDVLFNTGYDVEGDGGSQLTNDDVSRMRGIIASTSAALKCDGRSSALLLRRAALLVALGEPALARKDYERVLEIDPTNPDARKYVDLAGYGAAFDPYEILGVSRDADSAVVALAFRRLAKQWHPDRWISASAPEQLEAETRFKQINLAQGVLIDKAKRRKYDAGTASVADLMMGWWEKVREKHFSLWGSTSARGIQERARRAPALQSRAAELSAAKTETLTLKLTGCSSGIGVGVDKENVVDMLVPGKAAARQLQVGDKILEWNGRALFERRAGRMEQRKLIDVVKPGAETQTVKVQRAHKPGLPAEQRR